MPNCGSLTPKGSELSASTICCQLGASSQAALVRPSTAGSPQVRGRRSGSIAVR